MNNMKRQNDRIPKEELPRSLGAQYATRDQWRNNSRKNEGSPGSGWHACCPFPFHGGYILWWLRKSILSYRRTRPKPPVPQPVGLSKAWEPTPVFLPGESQGRGSLVGCRLWGRRVGYGWSDLAAAAAAAAGKGPLLSYLCFLSSVSYTYPGS